MTEEEKIDILIDTMTKLIEIEAQSKNVRKMLETLSVQISKKAD